MRQLKYRVTYGMVLNGLERFPQILKPYREPIEALVKRAKTGFQKDAKILMMGMTGASFIIHGDLRTGK
jgi:hypothetical protein